MSKIPIKRAFVEVIITHKWALKLGLEMGLVNLGLGLSIHINVENPRVHMWEPRWGAILSIQGPEAGFFLANHEGELHGVRPKFRQVSTVLPSVKSLSRIAHFNDQPMVVCCLGD